MLTQSELKTLLHYDPNTGIFTWLVSRAKGKANTRAGFVGQNGYRRIGICGGVYLEHRLVWLYVYGAWPSGQIDHKDGVRDNNALSNLRVVFGSGNRENLGGAQRNNQSGFLGVWYHPRLGKFRASIKVKGKLRMLGHYPTPEAAHAAYLLAKEKLHPHSLRLAGGEQQIV